MISFFKNLKLFVQKILNNLDILLIKVGLKIFLPLIIFSILLTITYRWLSNFIIFNEYWVYKYFFNPSDIMHWHQPLLIFLFLLSVIRCKKCFKENDFNTEEQISFYLFEIWTLQYFTIYLLSILIFGVLYLIFSFFNLELSMFLHMIIFMIFQLLFVTEIYITDKKHPKK